MTAPPTLYVGIAAPLVEIARVWIVELPEFEDKKALQDKLRAFPRKDTNAYGLSLSDASALAFRTGYQVNEDRVKAAVDKWAGKPPDLLPDPIEKAVPAIDHRRALHELQNALKDRPIRIAPRIGLTLQGLRRDLREYQPELVLLNCHGTPEGCLLFEDGRGRADVVSGERLFPLFEPRPHVLFLSACQSGAVLRRATELAEWDGSAIVYINADEPVEVAACVAFQSAFYTALLRGETAGNAFEDARGSVADDPVFGDLSVPAGDLPPSRKFEIAENGRTVSLPPSDSTSDTPQDDEAAQRLPYPHRLRRASERFVGRRREMAQILDALLPTRAGVGRPGGDRRVVTLTKEGGIGKTATALEIVDWTLERRCFPGGVFELPCEFLSTDPEFLTRLLAVFGVPPEGQKGNLLDLLAAVLPQALPSDRPALLLLDNMDDLLGQHAPQAVRGRTGEILETALTAAPGLRILATCRWPLGLADYETDLEVPPMTEDEARDVFVSHLDSPAHKLEVAHTWDRPDSAIRQLVRMSGRHPQSLRLLARQACRPAMTLDRLRDEAREDLLKVLTDPLAADDEQDRIKKVEVSYALSYRHLSDNGKRLFERLSHLPGGVWCGEFPERVIPWDALLGEGWREVMEKELDYYALVHYEPDGPNGEAGAFQMLPSMVEFAGKNYAASDHGEWEKTWIDFWQQRIGAWNNWISGRLPDDVDLPEDRRREAGAQQQQLATELFAQAEPNWLAAFGHIVQTDASQVREFLLDLVSFYKLSGRRVLLKTLSQQAVDTLRASGPEEDLAACLGTLGTVHRDLGDRDAARECYTEALEIYAPLFAKWPQAFGRNLLVVLRNYTNVTEESPEDPWWRMWKQFQEHA